MSKHTPGPWKANGLRVESGDTAIVVPAIGVPNDQAGANARLIAAAPELWMEAEFAAMKVRTLLKSLPPQIALRHSLKEWIESLDSVLAKARGE